MSKIIGIDLGTTNSVVSVLEGGKPVVIPNFAFGGGTGGTMVANDSQYIVPNYANGGDAIFNQNMASSIGLPANARKVRAASGYIPNFVNEDEKLVLFTGDRGGDFKKTFHVGKKGNVTKAYASKSSAPKGMRTVPITVPTYRMKGGKSDSEPMPLFRKSVFNVIHGTTNITTFFINFPIFHRKYRFCIFCCHSD